MRRLVQRHIESVAELELLLLARRTRRSWTAEEASRELRTSFASASMHLTGLARKGLVARDSDAFTYALSGELDEAVAQLERAYATHRTRIIELIFR